MRDYKRGYRSTDWGRQKTRAQARAEKRAFDRLRRMYPVEWGKLLGQERAKEPVLNEEYRKGVTA